jgi:hypothetical protein
MTTTHRIATTAALIVSVAAAGAPVAGARPTDYMPTGKQAAASVYSRPDKSMIAASAPSSAAFVAGASVPQAIVRVQAPQGGFDWGDAGIGAVGGVALSLLGLGGGLAISRRWPQRTRRTGALPS